MKILTFYDLNTGEWTAFDRDNCDFVHFDDPQPHFPLGHGEDQAEAIDDLLEQINNRD